MANATNAATLHPDNIQFGAPSIHSEIDRSKRTEHNRNYTTKLAQDLWRVA